MNDKFQRFLAMTDHPERFSDKELMELVNDPEMAAWYQMLVDVKNSVRHTPRNTKARFPIRFIALNMLTAAAAIILILLLLPPKDTTETIPQPQTEIHAATSDGRIAVIPKREKEESSITEVQAPKRSAPRRSGKHKVHKEKLMETDTPPNPQIPSDKQALADIYLAEVALQVAYELQAQQASVQAYTTSLDITEDEAPQSIISF